MVGSPNPRLQPDRTAEWNERWEAGEVRIVVVPDYGIMHVDAGKVLGYDVQLLTWWSRQTGHPISWQYAASVQEALDAVRAGTADVAVGPIPPEGLGELRASAAVREFQWLLSAPAPTPPSDRNKIKKSLRSKKSKVAVAAAVPGGYPKPAWMLLVDSLNVQPAATGMFRFAGLDSGRWLMPDYILAAKGGSGTKLRDGSFHWALRPTDSLLQRELDNLLLGRSGSRVRGALAKQRLPKPSAKDSLISPYDASLVGHDGWDRFMLNALIFAESRFNPSIVSPAGAVGLMQLLPSTANRMNRGPVDLTDPKANIRVGLRYLRYLDLFWEARGIPEDQRLPFVMASYNTGPSPIERAQQKAKSKGYDPHRWFGHVDQVAKGPGGHYARTTRDLAQQYRGFSSAWRRAWTLANEPKTPKTESK